MSSKVCIEHAPADSATVRCVLMPDPHVSRVGGRGIGALGKVGVAAAIANALYHATGNRIRNRPVHIADLLG